MMQNSSKTSMKLIIFKDFWPTSFQNDQCRGSEERVGLDTYSINKGAAFICVLNSDKTLNRGALIQERSKIDCLKMCQCIWKIGHFLLCFFDGAMNKHKHIHEASSVRHSFSFLFCSSVKYFSWRINCTWCAKQHFKMLIGRKRFKCNYFQSLVLNFLFLHVQIYFVKKATIHGLFQNKSQTWMPRLFSWLVTLGLVNFRER